MRDAEADSWPRTPRPADPMTFAAFAAAKEHV